MGLSMKDTLIKRWRVSMGWTQQRAADALGMALKNYQQLDKGVYMSGLKQGEPIKPDKRTLLACRALMLGCDELKPEDIN